MHSPLKFTRKYTHLFIHMPVCTNNHWVHRGVLVTRRRTEANQAYEWVFSFWCLWLCNVCSLYTYIWTYMSVQKSNAKKNFISNAYSIFYNFFFFSSFHFTMQFCIFSNNKKANKKTDRQASKRQVSELDKERYSAMQWTKRKKKNRRRDCALNVAFIDGRTWFASFARANFNGALFFLHCNAKCSAKKGEKKTIKIKHKNCRVEKYLYRQSWQHWRVTVLGAYKNLHTYMHT